MGSNYEYVAHIINIVVAFKYLSKNIDVYNVCNNNKEANSSEIKTILFIR